ncbi:TadG family pilus assembly protein [Sandaracinobacter sp.]|uniref:TadG family pilus assembly protein n=1 Tax=Sandaracinobacter sp. TaxID=2487581 RepID=UPI0035AFDF69
MIRISRNLKRLRRDKSGVVAMLVALSLPMLVGAAALTIDIANFRYVQGRMQSAADAGALAGIAKLDTPTDAKAAAADYAGRNVPAAFGDVTKSSDVEIGIWDPVARTFAVSSDPALINAVRVSAVRSATRQNGVPTILMHYFSSSSPNIQATAIAARQLVVQYEPPEKTDLDNQAWDYNRIYAYCYKYTGSGTPESRRSQMALVADNVPKNGTGVSNFWTEAGKRGFGKVPNPLVWPECEKGESLSFRLENIRDVKQAISNTTTTKTLWTSYDKNKSKQTFNHYTDTAISGGVETFPGLGSEKLVETIRCDTLSACTAPSKHVKGTPLRVAGVPCLPGKYMYFGWEDRPPSSGGSDEDYDDIRITMRCPKTGTLGDGMSRLVS